MSSTPPPDPPPPDFCVPCQDKQLVCMGNVLGQWNLLMTWKMYREQTGNKIPKEIRVSINKARNDVLNRKGEAAQIVSIYDQALAGRIRDAGIVDGFNLLMFPVPGMVSSDHHDLIEAGESAELDISECLKYVLEKVGWVDPTELSGRW